MRRQAFTPLLNCRTILDDRETALANLLMQMRLVQFFAINDFA
jgi:hypothetical protein